MTSTIYQIFRLWPTQVVKAAGTYSKPECPWFNSQARLSLLDFPFYHL